MITVNHSLIYPVISKSIFLFFLMAEAQSIIKGSLSILRKATAKWAWHSRPYCRVLVLEFSGPEKVLHEAD